MEAKVLNGILSAHVAVAVRLLKKSERPTPDLTCAGSVLPEGKPQIVCSFTNHALLAFEPPPENTNLAQKNSILRFFRGNVLLWPKLIRTVGKPKNPFKMTEIWHFEGMQPRVHENKSRQLSVVLL